MLFLKRNGCSARKLSAWLEAISQTCAVQIKVWERTSKLLGLLTLKRQTDSLDVSAGAAALIGSGAPEAHLICALQPSLACVLEKTSRSRRPMKTAAAPPNFSV